MGKRSTGKVEGRAVGAFARQRVWGAMDLAQAVATDLEDLVTGLNRLRSWGLPISHRVRQGQVEYSVSQAWFELWNGKPARHRRETLASSGEGKLEVAHTPRAEGQSSVKDRYGAEQRERAVEELEFTVEALLRMPRGAMRDSVLRRVLEGQFRTAGADVSELCVGLSQAANQSLQELLLTAASSRLTVSARVFDARGKLTVTRLTVHRVVPSPNGIVATEHALNKLKWYPYECIVSASLVRDEKGRRADPDELEAFMDNLLNHHSQRSTIEHAFTVRYPEADWVATHLPPGMWVDEGSLNDERLRVVVRDNGPLAARLVASLGGAAMAEGPVLTGLVTGIAAGTLAAHRSVVAATVPVPTEATQDDDKSAWLDEEEAAPYHGDGLRRSTFRPRRPATRGEPEMPCVVKAPLDDVGSGRSHGAALKPRS